MIRKTKDYRLKTKDYRLKTKDGRQVIRLSGYQKIRVQVIMTAGYQVKEQKPDDKQEGNFEYRISNKEY